MRGEAEMKAKRRIPSWKELNRRYWINTVIYMLCLALILYTLFIGCPEFRGMECCSCDLYRQFNITGNSTSTSNLTGLVNITLPNQLPEPPVSQHP